MTSHQRLLFIITVLLYTGVNFQANAQNSETIQTDRPGQAIVPYTVGKNTIQGQHGIDYTHAEDNAITEGMLIDNVIKYGIGSNIELNTLIDYQSTQTNTQPEVTKQSGFSNVHVGFRVKLFDEKKILPAIGFQMRMKIPGISKDYASKYTSPFMILTTNKSTTSGIGMTTNWTVSWNGNDGVPTGGYVINLSFPIYKKLSGYIENYGQVYNETFETRYDGGFAYLLHNNLQLDLYGGYGSNHGVEDYFISTGISWRLNLKKTP